MTVEHEVRSGKWPAVRANRRARRTVDTPCSGVEKETNVTNPMRLRLNGEEQAYDGVKTAGDLLDRLDMKRERVAVMINGDVVRRANLDAAKLHDGDVVEVITMVGGG